jgi:hypothetical protein
MNNFKVGQWIWTYSEGWTRIVGMSSPRMGDCCCDIFFYSIKTNAHIYDIKAYQLRDDVHPSIYTYDPINGTKPPTHEHTITKGENIMNCEFKVGQSVWSIEDGWSKVVEIRNSSRFFDTSYPIITDTGRGYTLEGRGVNTHKHPSLFTFDPINDTTPPK